MPAAMAPLLTGDAQFAGGPWAYCFVLLQAAFFPPGGMAVLGMIMSIVKGERGQQSQESVISFE